MSAFTTQILTGGWDELPATFQVNKFYSCVFVGDSNPAEVRLNVGETNGVVQNMPEAVTLTVPAGATLTFVLLCTVSSMTMEVQGTAADEVKFAITVM